MQVLGSPRSGTPESVQRAYYPNSRQALQEARQKQGETEETGTCSHKLTLRWDLLSKVGRSESLPEDKDASRDTQPAPGSVQDMEDRQDLGKMVGAPWRMTFDRISCSRARRIQAGSAPVCRLQGANTRGGKPSVYHPPGTF